MKTAIVMVVYNQMKNWDWTKFSISNLRKYLPKEKIVVIDHNNIKEERDFLLSQQVTIIENTGEKSHGAGLDLGVEWCRVNKFDAMVAIEPDCKITDRKWYDKITNEVDGGYYLAGVHRLDFGPIHPCGTCWSIDKIRFSFKPCLKSTELNDKEYLFLFNEKKYYDFLNYIGDNHPYVEEENSFRDGCLFSYWVHRWDCGLRNWYDMASQGKERVVEVNDFLHYFCGSQSTPLTYQIKSKKTKSFI